MIIVGYVSNPNGMASWCWETANALLETGMEVCVICSDKALIPSDNKVKTVLFDMEDNFAGPSNLFTKIQSQFIGRLSLRSTPFCSTLHAHLLAQGITPDTYLFNQPDLIDPALKLPQHVVAWAYPSSFWGYISKVGRLSGWKFNKNFLFTVLDAIGWFRRDWHAYRKASSVMAVSERLNGELVNKKITSNTVYPCIRTEAQPQGGRPALKSAKVKIVISALYLEEPRKRVAWLLESVEGLPAQNFEIHLLGQASEAFVTRFKKLPLIFYGKLRREQALEVMKDKDIFLFGSVLDDWGYVQTEALSKGMVVIAPNLSPFDEIVGHSEFLYKSDSPDDLRNKLMKVIDHTQLSLLKSQSEKRAEQLFSRKIFAATVISLMKHSTN